MATDRHEGSDQRFLARRDSRSGSGTGGSSSCRPDPFAEGTPRDGSRVASASPASRCTYRRICNRFRPAWGGGILQTVTLDLAVPV